MEINAGGDIDTNDEAHGVFGASDFYLTHEAAALRLGNTGRCGVEWYPPSDLSAPARATARAMPDRQMASGMVPVHCALACGPAASAAGKARNEVIRDEISASMAEAANAFTALLLHGDVISRMAGSAPVGEISASAEQIIANAHRAWHHVRHIGALWSMGVR